MNEILEVLVRLMAPILSFTAEEIWQYMKGESRPLSVHVDLFRSANDAYEDPELAGRWEEIITLRKEVTKMLEVSRKEKTVGHPLDASVTLGVSPQLMEKLLPYQDQLRSIFIVSSVDIVDITQTESGVESETIPGLKVLVTPSSDPKCERCWIHDPTVGHDNNHPTVCKRCVKVLAEITT